MASWILKLLSKLMGWTINHKRSAIELFLGILLACSVCAGIILHRQNKSLSESLNKATNNIEYYENAMNGEVLKNNTLRMTIQDLENTKDSLINKIKDVAKENKIKLSKVSTAATQTQSLYVNGGKGVEGQLIEILKDTTYTDSIRFNDQTEVAYCIGPDTVNIALNISNTQYLYTYRKKEYKNKKNFFKRLFTLDFKKIWKYRYEIINTNDLIETSDVRVIEITEK